MPMIAIEDLNDSRLTVYRDLRNTNLTRQSGHFVAEGARVVERLLRSRFEVRSIFLNEKHQQLLAKRFATLCSSQTDIFLVPERAASELIGFPFHEGVLACGVREENPTLDSILQPKPCLEKKPIVLCCPKITSPDNLGSLVRLGASFGIQGILLGHGSVDPYIRRVIRVSMGTFFNLPIRSSDDLYSELKEQKNQNRGLILAAEKSEDSIPLEHFSEFDGSLNSNVASEQKALQNHRPLFILLGNESEGLDQKWLNLAKATLHIPMAAEVDSLNITHAAALFLYELTRKN